VIYNGRRNQIQFVSPTNLTIRNSQTLADGSLDPNRLLPRNGGFGSVSGAMGMRTVQLMARFSF
jgi:hypothetical protein